MPEHAEFRDLYLSEIGIHRPFPADRTDPSEQITDETKPEGAAVAPSPVSSQPEAPSLPAPSTANTAVDGSRLADIAIQASSCTA